MRESGIRERIIDATLRCVARWGVAKTTLDDVAREAGCGRATIYRTFSGGKAAVLQATLVHEAARALRLVDDAARTETTLEAVLVAGTKAASTFLRDHDALQFLLAHEPDLVLPHVAFDNLSRVLDAGAAVTSPHLARFLPATEVRQASEWVTRVVLSYTLGPSPALDLRTDDGARHLVRTYLLPALVPQGVQSSV